jgi:hypothetical protein
MSKSLLEEMRSYNTHDSGSSHKNAKEADWVIKIDKITKSTVQGFTAYAVMLDHSFALTRGVENHTANSIRPDGGMIGYDLNVVVKSSSISAQLNQLFAENEVINSIDICRLVRLNKKVDTVEEYTFTSCYVVGILTKGDDICIAFR